VLNKRYRLTKRGSFNYVYKKGSSQSCGAIRLTYVRGKGLAKIGVRSEHGWQGCGAQ